MNDHSKFFELWRDDTGVAPLRLNRPERMNTITPLQSAIFDTEPNN